MMICRLFVFSLFLLSLLIGPVAEVWADLCADRCACSMAQAQACCCAEPLEAETGCQTDCNAQGEEAPEVSALVPRRSSSFNHIELFEHALVGLNPCHDKKNVSVVLFEDSSNSTNHKHLYLLYSSLLI